MGPFNPSLYAKFQPYFQTSLKVGVFEICSLVQTNVILFNCRILSFEFKCQCPTTDSKDL